MHGLELRRGLPGFARFHLVDAYAHVVPRRLPGDRVRVRVTLPIHLRRELLRDDVIEQETLLRLVRIRRQIPRAGGLADGVPGPYRARLNRLAVARHAAHLTPLRLDPDPVTVGDARVLRGARVDI